MACAGAGLGIASLALDQVSDDNDAASTGYGLKRKENATASHRLRLN